MIPAFIRPDNLYQVLSDRELCILLVTFLVFCEEKKQTIAYKDSYIQKCLSCNIKGKD